MRITTVTIETLNASAASIPVSFRPPRSCTPRDIAISYVNTVTNHIPSTSLSSTEQATPAAPFSLRRTRGERPIVQFRRSSCSLRVCARSIKVLFYKVLKIIIFWSCGRLKIAGTTLIVRLSCVIFLILRGREYICRINSASKYIYFLWIPVFTEEFQRFALGVNRYRKEGSQKEEEVWVCAPCVHCGLPCANFSKFIRHAVNAKSGPNSTIFVDVIQPLLPRQRPHKFIELPGSRRFDVYLHCARSVTRIDD